jgi:(E)-4-hydroxy-3-methylbut-2-enyl-diphosphate synthase
MTAGYTHDIDACVREIHKLAAGGADVVRVAVPEKKDTDALRHIIPQVRVPIVADVHFHFQRALEAVEAGVHKIRLNPGNINDREQVIEVIKACKARGLPIRVGVNEGSIIERRDKQKRMKELGAVFSDKKHGYMLAIMIAKLEEYLDIFYEQDFYDIVISAKSMDAALVVDAYTEISKRFDRSVAALSALLCNGIGDTIRISYANDPIYEVEDGLELLWSLGLRERKGVDLIACPTCGRIQVDLFTLVQDVRKQLAAKVTVPMKVAVMGCIVNGPGEAEGADVAVFAGDRRGIIYVQGERVANVPEPEILDRLLAECLEFQGKVLRGEVKLGEKKVSITPPDPLGELGSGWEKVAAGMVEKTGSKPAKLTIGGR